MTSPEDALAAARAAAAAARARGGYEALPELSTDEPPLAEKLVGWAVIEPDVREVRSTRRAGRPFTALKQGLLRLLAQYHTLLIAEQTRFNLNHLRYTRSLEQRITELERRLEDDAE